MKTEETPIEPIAPSFGGTYDACAIELGTVIELHGASSEQLSKFLREHPKARRRDGQGWH